MDPVAKKSDLESEYYKLSEDEQDEPVIPVQQAKFDTSIFARLKYSYPADLWRLIYQYKLYG
uniref:Uncharacterized protein n=1 Tax=viral metagenome TaxID=1070528 RepID=A0A6M3LKF5_9ZZZZ